MAIATPKPQSSSSSSSLKTFIVTSVNFWFVLSLASSTLSLAFFSTTTFYTAHFAPFGTPFLTLTTATATALRFLIFLSHIPLRTLISHRPRFRDLASLLLVAAAASLLRVPEFESVAGLCYVICAAVDLLAIMQIIRLRISGFAGLVVYQIHTGATARAWYLYGNKGYWLMFSFTSALMVVSSLIDSWIEEDMKKMKKKEAEESTRLSLSGT